MVFSILFRDEGHHVRNTVKKNIKLVLVLIVNQPDTIDMLPQNLYIIMTISSLMSPWYVNMGSQYKHTRASIQHPAPLLKIFFLINKLLTLLSRFRVQIYDRKWFKYFFSAFSLGQFFCLGLCQVFCLNLCSAENSSSPVIQK